MLLDDDIAMIYSQFDGVQLATHHQDRPLLMCRFGPAQSISLIAIGKNLDRLLVLDLALLRSRLLSGQNLEQSDLDLTGQQLQSPVISYIVMEDQVISTVAVTEFEPHSRLDERQRDFILIGCTDSIMVYDTLDQEHLFSVRTSTRITTIVAASTSIETSPVDRLTQSLSRLLFCGGVQKLYVIQMDCGNRLAMNTIPETNVKLINFEMSNERTISETVRCMIVGRFGSFECLIVGFQEGRIKLFTVDSFDQTIQMCRMSLMEMAKINCLCPIETVSPPKKHQDKPLQEAQTHELFGPRVSSDLPPIIDGDTNKGSVPQSMEEHPQMNYFACGLENGSVSVYQLLAVVCKEADGATDDQVGESAERQKVSISSERLWRHRGKHAVVALTLFDIDGDGQDELIVGYKNGLLEARYAFTGQLLMKTRCFRATRSEIEGQRQQLVGLIRWTMNEVDLESKLRSGPETGSSIQADRILLACSSSGSLVAFKPRQKRLRHALVDYMSNKIAFSEGDEIEIDTQLTRNINRREERIDEINGQGDDQDSQQLSAIVESVDDKLDNAKKPPINSESRQNPDLLQQIGKMKKNLSKLRHTYQSAHTELLRKQLASHRGIIELNYDLASLDPYLIGLTKLSHCWSFDDANNTLLVSYVMEPKSGFSVSIDMVEVSDPSRRFLASGHLILNPVKNLNLPVGPQLDETFQITDSNAGSKSNFEIYQSVPGAVALNLVLASSKIALYRQEKSLGGQSTRMKMESVELRVSFFVTEVDITRSQSELEPRLKARRSIYERSLVLPKFAMFVPESLLKLAPDQAQTNRPMIKKTIILPERTKKMSILDWMHSNFLYLQLDQTIGDGDQVVAGPYSSQNSLAWDGLSNDREKEMSHLDSNMLMDIRKLSSASNSTNSDAKELDAHAVDQDEGGFEFQLVDLESFHESIIGKSDGNCRRLRLNFSPEDRHLTLESNDSDLLVDVIQMLIIERLGLNLSEHALDDKSEVDGIEILLKELKTINENCRQLEESERRIQTEIYESAEIIKCLMQQLGVANDLQEYEISRELLSEITMMLNGTQNSAHAFNLNSRSRLNLVKEANCLREKVLFLTGGDENHIGSN